MLLSSADDQPVAIDPALASPPPAGPPMMAPPPAPEAGHARRRSAARRRARPPAAPAVAAHAALATETRRSVLDAYAAKLAARDAALDARAEALRDGEARVAAAAARARAEADDAAQHERALRAERAEFRQRVAERERRLAEMDGEKADALFECRRSAAEAARRAALKKDTVEDLEETQHALGKLSEELRAVSADLDAARAQQAMIEAEVQSAEQHRERLRSLESQLAVRESTLRDREKQNSELASSLNAELDLIRREKAALDQHHASVAQRERDTAAREGELRRREASARDGVARANQLSRDAHYRLEALEKERAALVREATELDSRETAIRSRELRTQELESSLAAKDQEIRRIQAALEAREQSIGRARATVTARENTVDRKASALDAREDTLDSRERELAAYENAARSREMELKAREDSIARMVTEMSRQRTRTQDVPVDRDAKVAASSLPLGSSVQRDRVSAEDDDEAGREHPLADMRTNVKAEYAATRQPEEFAEESERSNDFHSEPGRDVEAEASQALAAWISNRAEMRNLTKGALRAAEELAPFCARRRVESVLRRIQDELGSLLKAVEHAEDPEGRTVFDALSNEMKRHEEWQRRRKAQLSALAEIGNGILAARQWDAHDQDSNSKTVTGIVSGILATENWNRSRIPHTGNEGKENTEDRFGPGGTRTGSLDSGSEASEPSRDSVFGAQDRFAAVSILDRGGEIPPGSVRRSEVIDALESPRVRVSRSSEDVSGLQHERARNFRSQDSTLDIGRGASVGSVSVEVANTERFAEFRNALRGYARAFGREDSADADLSKRVDEALREAINE